MKELSLLVTFLLICSLFPVTEAGVVAPSAILADKAWELGFTGKGVNIAVISTGIDNEHPGLEGKFIAGYDAVCSDDALCIASLQEDNGSFDPDDQDGEGTAVAAMATSTGLLANGEQSNFLGSAPDAKLIDVRVASTLGSGPFENYIVEQEFYESTVNGIQWVIDNKDTAWYGAENDSYGIDIMVLPFGITSHEDGGSDGSDMFSQILDEAMLAGIVVVVAAGNDGSSNDGFSAMASSSLAITVGAIDDKNSASKEDDGLASYSSRGPRRDNNDGNAHNELKPDVVAPGTNIVQAEACVVSGSCYNRISGQNASDNEYSNRGSGTGYAAAYVAGVAALLLEQNPELTSSEVKEIIQISADRKETLSSADGEGIEEGDWATYPELEPRWNRHFGYGVVNASAIVTHSIPKYSANFVDDVVNLDVRPGASGVGCTEMVISNLGTIVIDVDVTTSGSGVTISPGAVSVTLGPGGSITIPICALALTRSEAKIVQVSALASGRETNTQLNQVQVISNFTASIDPYARLSIQVQQPSASHCIGSTFETNFTGVNNGNANDSVVFELTNIQELEDAGFTITLPILQYQVDAAGEQPMSIKVVAENVTPGIYTMIVKISTTMEGETEARSVTATVNMTNCQGDNSDSADTETPCETGDTKIAEDGCNQCVCNNKEWSCTEVACIPEDKDQGIPSISLVTSLISIGLLAIFRRK